MENKKLDELTKALNRLAVAIENQNTKTELFRIANISSNSNQSMWMLLLMFMLQNSFKENPAVAESLLQNLNKSNNAEKPAEEANEENNDVESINE